MKFMFIVLFCLTINVTYAIAEKYNLLNFKDDQNNLVYSVWGERDIAIDNVMEKNLIDVRNKNLQVKAHAYSVFDTLNLYFVSFEKSEMSDETRFYIGIWKGNYFEKEDEVILDYFPTIEQQKNIVDSITVEKDSYYKNLQFYQKNTSMYDIWRKYYIDKKSNFENTDSTSTN